MVTPAFKFCNENVNWTDPFRPFDNGAEVGFFGKYFLFKLSKHFGKPKIKVSFNGFSTERNSVVSDESNPSIARICLFSKLQVSCEVLTLSNPALLFFNKSFRLPSSLTYVGEWWQIDEREGESRRKVVKPQIASTFQFWMSIVGKKGPTIIVKQSEEKLFY